MVVHDNLYLYECKYCFKKFGNSSGLNTHIRGVHTLERPYKCTECNQAFAASSNLNQHILIHTNEKQHKCSVAGCNAEFNRFDNLQSHLRVHTKEKPYDCKICNEKFSWKHILKRHIARYHTIDGMQRQKRKESNLAYSLNLKGYHYTREHQVTFSCSGGTFARIDFLLQLQNWTSKQAFIVALELDEGEHKDRPVSCEIKRMTDVAHALLLEGNELPLVWIRYNCDSFRIDGATQKISQKNRQSKLFQLLETLQSSTCNISPFSVHYLFYSQSKNNGDNLTLDIFYDPDYSKDFKQYVVVHPA